MPGAMGASAPGAILTKRSEMRSAPVAKLRRVRARAIVLRQGLALARPPRFPTLLGSVSPLRSGNGLLRQQRLNNITRDIGQSIIPPFVPVDKLFVIDTEQIKHRGVQIVDVHWIAHD